VENKMIEITIKIQPDKFERKTKNLQELQPARTLIFNESGELLKNVFEKVAERRDILLLTFGKITMSIADINSLWQVSPQYFGKLFSVSFEFPDCPYLFLQTDSYSLEQVQDKMHNLSIFLNKLFRTEVKF
jgi:hypothetical protein